MAKKSNNYYLNQIAERLTGNDIDGSLSNNYYLKVISENIGGGGGSVDDALLREKIDELIQEYGVEEILNAIDQQGYTKNVRLEGDELIFD